MFSISTSMPPAEAGAVAATRKTVVLTPAQHRVVAELVRDGADDLTIAARLFVTKHTIKTHMKRAMAASGHTTRTALAVDVLRGRVVIQVENRRWSRNTLPRIEQGAWS